MKRGLKKTIFMTLYLLGFYRIWRKFHDKGIVVLTAHGVVDENESGEWTQMRPKLSVQVLEEAIRLTSKYYEFVSLAEAVDMLSGRKKLRKNCVVMTFDDGYSNNLRIAWPILKKYGVPAILFPSVGHVETGEPFWYDRLDCLIQQAIKSKMKSCVILDKQISLQADDSKGVKRCVMKAIAIVKSVQGNDSEIMTRLAKDMEGLEAQLDVDINKTLKSDISTAVASWDELKRAASEGLAVGSHTVSHARLSRTNRENAQYELVRSKEILEQKLGQTCEFVCYPNGCFNQTVKKLAREAGYIAGLTTREGINQVGCDLMQIRRFHIPQYNASGAEALAIASGLSYKLHKLKRIFTKRAGSLTNK